MTATVSHSMPKPAEVRPARSRGSWRLKLRRILSGLASRIGRLPKPLSVPLRPVAVVLEGFSIGILRPADVDRMVAETYESQPRFYDPRRYRLPYEQRLLPELTRLTGDRKRLLDAFCGQGREAELFARHGFDVTAIDRLDWMIDAARRYADEAGFTASFVAADFESFSGPPPFDVVYTSCWMYSTRQTAANRLHFLNRCRDLCARDGLVVISSVSDAGDSRLATVVRFLAARLAAVLTFGNLRTEPGERIYSGLFWHHLSDQTVSQETAAAGLATVCVIPGQQPEPTFRILRPASSAELEA